MHKFVNHEQQELLIEKAIRRLNRPNPLDSGLRFQFPITSCPSKSDPGWKHFEIQDINDHRHDYHIPIPELDDKDRLSLIYLVLGNYRIRMAKKYTSLQVWLFLIFHFSSRVKYLKLNRLGVKLKKTRMNSKIFLNCLRWQDRNLKNFRFQPEY